MEGTGAIPGPREVPGDAGEGREKGFACLGNGKSKGVSDKLSYKWPVTSLVD